MIDGADRQATADAIAELAKHHQFRSRRDELADVADAISGPEHGHSWGGVDLVAYFASPDDPNSTRTSWLDVVRLPLVLVPILVTWFGLWDAARAHAAMRADGLEEASRPFLSLWQDGFNGYSHLTLQKVAIIDVFAISLVIILTVIATNRERMADRADAARTATDLEMASWLRRGQRALRSAEVATPADLQREFTKAVSSLARLDSAALAAERIVDGFSRLETCIAKVEANTQSFASAATETQAVMKDFAAEVTGQLRETNQVMTSHSQGLEQGIEAVNTSAGGLVNAAHGMTSSISSGLVDLSATVSGLVTMADRLQASVHDLVTEDSASQQALAERIRLIKAASKAAADSEASLTAGATQVTALAGAVTQAATTLAAGSHTLDSRLSGTISDFERFLVAQLEATEQLKLMATSAGVTARILQEELAPLLRQKRTAP